MRNGADRPIRPAGASGVVSRYWSIQDDTSYRESA
jgi:hypothetical protein